uniref:Uncharacterized protein n=1 Tax=Glossina austeni TaxID=7395 RepID=A0A1A9VNV8_GLOAU
MRAFALSTFPPVADAISPQLSLAPRLGMTTLLTFEDRLQSGSLFPVEQRALTMFAGETSTKVSKSSSDATFELASSSFGKAFFTGCLKKSLESTSFSKGAIIFVDNFTLRLGNTCSGDGINTQSWCEHILFIKHFTRDREIEIRLITKGFSKNQINSEDLIIRLCAAAIEFKLNSSHSKKDYLKDLLTLVLLLQLKVNPLHSTGEVLRDGREESAFACSLSLSSMHDGSPDIPASCFGDSFSIIREFSIASKESLDPVIKSSNGEVLCAEEVSAVLDSSNSNTTLPNRSTFRRKIFDLICLSLNIILRRSTTKVRRLCRERGQGNRELSNSSLISRRHVPDKNSEHLSLCKICTYWVNEVSEQIHIINETKSRNVVVCFWLPINKAEGTKALSKLLLLKKPRLNTNNKQAFEDDNDDIDNPSTPTTHKFNIILTCEKIFNIIK